MDYIEYLTLNSPLVIISDRDDCVYVGHHIVGLLLLYIFYRTQVSLGSDLWVLMSLTPRGFADLTDVTLADEDSNSIPTDDVNCQWAIPGNVAMQVAPPGGQN